MAFLALTGCGGEAPTGSSEPSSAGGGKVWFEDVRDTGVSFVHRTGLPPRYLFPEIAAGGAGLLDYDGDGLLDLYFVQAGDPDETKPDRPGNALYRNAGELKFEDVTAASGTGDTGYGMGCAAGDYDGDGHVDLYVSNVGANVLLRNESGQRFADVSAASGAADASWGTSTGFLDHDRDGDLDLFCVNYVRWSVTKDMECFSGSGEREYCGPNSFQAPAPDVLLRNEGDGTFRDISQESGVTKAFGNGLGVAFADYDGDGAIDIYVANDGMPNQLWINVGTDRFEDRALALGCAVNMDSQSEAGMGVMAVDFDHDDDFDLFLSHLREETNTIYVNNGKWFDDATARLGLGRPSFEFTGFGLAFADFDHDAKLDIYVANGRVKRNHPSFDESDVHAEPNLLFVQAPDGKGYVEYTPRGGTARDLIHTSRAAAFGDLDNDGDVDIVVANKDARPYVLRNVAGERGHWLQLALEDARGHEALHASVTVEAGGTVLHGRAQRAYSYCATNDPRVHFGLGAATAADRVVVRWPDGATETFGPLAANELHRLRQGSGR